MSKVLLNSNQAVSCAQVEHNITYHLINCQNAVAIQK